MEQMSIFEVSPKMQPECEKLQDNIYSIRYTSAASMLHLRTTVTSLEDEETENNESDQNNLKIILNPRSGRMTDRFRCSR